MNAIQRFTVSLCRAGVLLSVGAAIALFSAAKAGAYTVVTSTAPGVEQDFLAATTTQFLSTVVPNPFFPNTQSVALFGLNPNYVAPGQLVPSLPCNLDQDVATLVSVTTQTFVYGWASGMVYQTQAEEGFVGSMGDLCQGATNFTLSAASTTTWNTATCQDVVSNIEDQLFNLSLSTPPVLPGEGL
jgi:hypothetical protein